MPRGRTEIGDFRDDETLRVSNHLTPWMKPTTREPNHTRYEYNALDTDEDNIGSAYQSDRGLG
jgi:hypothetical protein